MRITTHVGTGRATAGPGYDVMIGPGILEDLPVLVGEAVPAARYAVIAPRDVGALYGSRLVDRLLAAGLAAELFMFPAGELSKTREVWSSLTDRLLERQYGRDSCVIALGGGVTGDLAGFVAATYMRGLPVVQVPTTLLAMIDASVGGKTGVDTAAGKNLVGAFHPPGLVVIDPFVLRTLPPAELRSGMAEAVKHGAILDADYFEWIGSYADELLGLEPVAISELISRSVQLKAMIVQEDPAEQGRRAILNFGHTIGHALELRAGYTVPHGYAVSDGMVAEAALGEAAGVTARGTRDRLAAALSALKLPAAGSVPADLMNAMTLDKKARSGRPHLVLLERIGSTARAADGGWLHPVDHTHFDAVAGGRADV